MSPENAYILTLSSSRFYILVKDCWIHMIALSFTFVYMQNEWKGNIFCWGIVFDIHFLATVRYYTKVERGQL